MKYWLWQIRLEDLVVLGIAESGVSLNLATNRVWLETVKNCLTNLNPVSLDPSNSVLTTLINLFTGHYR